MNELSISCEMNEDGILSVKGVVFEDPFYVRWFEKYFHSIIEYFFNVEGIKTMKQFIDNWKNYKTDFEHCVMGSVVSYAMGAGL